MHILVTGVSSFVGSHLARHFLQIGHDVTATYRKRNAATARLSAEFSGPNLRMVSIDLADWAGYAALPRGSDIVVHVAGVSAADGISIDEILACVFVRFGA